MKTESQVFTENVPKWETTLTLEQFADLAMKSLPLFLKQFGGRREDAEEGHARWIARMIESGRWRDYNPDKGPIITFMRHYAYLGARDAASRNMLREGMKAKHKQSLGEHAGTLRQRSQINPDKRVEHRDTLRLALLSVYTLPPTQLKVVEAMIDTEGDVREARELVGMRPTQFYYHLSKARNTLRENAV